MCAAAMSLCRLQMSVEELSLLIRSTADLEMWSWLPGCQLFILVQLAALLNLNVLEKTGLKVNLLKYSLQAY